MFTTITDIWGEFCRVEKVIQLQEGEILITNRGEVTVNDAGLIIAVDED